MINLITQTAHRKEQWYSMEYKEMHLTKNKESTELSESKVNSVLLIAFSPFSHAASKLLETKVSPILLDQ